jgi:hypothetical protein
MPNRIVHPFANAKGRVISRAISGSVTSENVDVEAGILKDVVLCQAMQPRGEAGWDWTWVWTPPEDDEDWGDYQDIILRVVTPFSFIQQLKKLSAPFEVAGMQVRFGHPNECNPALGSFAGRAKNFRIRGEQIIADITLSDVAENSPGKQGLKSYILGMALENPDAMMMSIVFTPGNSYFINADGQEEDWDGSNGQGRYMLSLPEEDRIIYERVSAWHFTDFVDQGANTLDMFRGTSGELASRVTTFLDENPDVLRAIVSDPKVIGQFIERYNRTATALKSSNFLTMNKNQRDAQTLLGRIASDIKNLFRSTEGGGNHGGDPASSGEQKTIENTTAGGADITIETDADVPAVGNQVYLAGGTEVPPAGDHQLTGDLEGYTITTDDAGIITVVQEPAAAAPAADPEMSSADPEEGSRQILELARNQSEFAKTMKGMADQLQAIARDIEAIKEAPFGQRIFSDSGNRLSNRKAGQRSTETNLTEESIKKALGQV